jgi:hypothetical protein
MTFSRALSESSFGEEGDFFTMDTSKTTSALWPQRATKGARQEYFISKEKVCEKPTEDIWSLQKDRVPELC